MPLSSFSGVLNLFLCSLIFKEYTKTIVLSAWELSEHEFCYLHMRMHFMSPLSYYSLSAEKFNVCKFFVIIYLIFCYFSSRNRLEWITAFSNQELFEFVPWELQISVGRFRCLRYLSVHHPWPSQSRSSFVL